MAARSHLFPFRTEKLSSLSPMVLNFGRVGSRRFQESISLRLTPFFVRVRAQKPAAGLGQPPFPDSCPLRRLQSVTVVRGRCVTFGDRKILHHPSSTINLSCPDSCPLRRQQSVTVVRDDVSPSATEKSSTIHHQPSTINPSIFPFYFLHL